MHETAKYFDATFTEAELAELSESIRAKTGLHYLTFEFGLMQEAEKEIERTLGFFPHHVPRAWQYIHVCRSLGIDYKSFAKNAPKLSLEGFIAVAKRCFPEFQQPRNTIERRLQVQKVHTMWVDWLNDNCTCGGSRHTFCDDRYEERDYDAIIETIADYNKARPKLHLVT